MFPMFPVIVFVQQILWHWLYLRIDYFAVYRHFCHNFDHYGVMDCFLWRFAPSEGTVVHTQYSRYSHGVLFLKVFHD